MHVHIDSNRYIHTHIHSHTCACEHIYRGLGRMREVGRRMDLNCAKWMQGKRCMPLALQVPCSQYYSDCLKRTWSVLSVVICILSLSVQRKCAQWWHSIIFARVAASVLETFITSCVIVLLPRSLAMEPCVSCQGKVRVAVLSFSMCMYVHLCGCMCVLRRFWPQLIIYIYSILIIVTVIK